MKITEKDVTEIIDLIMEGRKNIDLIKSVSDAARPLLKESVILLSENLAEFKPMIKELSSLMFIYRINCINLYEENGFTRQEAIMLSISDTVALKESIRNYNNSIKK